MVQNSQVHHRLLAYLRHELCTPINGMIGYSELLLEELQTQPESSPESSLVGDLQKIHGCSRQLLTLVTAMLDPVLDPMQFEMSQIDDDLNSFGSRLRRELLTPLSAIIGYCEMLLEEAPVRLIPDLDKLNASAQRLTSLINDIVHLAQQQLQAINIQADSSPRIENSTAITLAQNAAILPALGDSALSQAASQEAAKKQPPGGMILVVDDDPTNCDLLARQLKRQAYTVTTTTNAQQALRLLKVISYDLILLDVIMPGINGLELLQQLKRHDTWRQIPVIMISALDEIESAVKCIELGAEDYLHKPFDPTLLKARIGAYLERKHLRDQEILYLKQMERLTAAAAAVETKTFNPESLNDLIRYPNKLGQLARVFQHMAQEVYSRERSLEQQVQLLQVSIDNSQKKRLVAEIAATAHFQQIQKRTKSNLDIQPPRPAIASPAGNMNPAIVNPSKIVVVHSFRGGTGKSNLTSNLAISVAKQGKRVGIIDTDLQSPGIHVLFGLEDEAIDRTLNDYLWGQCALSEAAYDLSYLLQNQSPNISSSSIPGNIYLIPASSKPNSITRILREGYHEEILLDGFSEVIRDLQLDFLFLDTHPGINEETLQAIAVCNLLLVVLRPDYQDYQGTAVIVELARLLSVAELSLVVNKALPSFDVEPYRQQLEAAYGVSVAEILPFSEEMMQLASSEIFSVCCPNHPLTQAVDALGRRMVEQVKPGGRSCPY
jgi:MinD-like ATPase involved in chromosome partitioning or flagellar assembly/DNA-binding response OmpR family regulator